MINVIKYANRKLYRKDISKYTTLVELRQLIQDDLSFEVKSYNGQDITRDTLQEIVNLSVKFEKEFLIDCIKTNKGGI